MFEMSSSAMVGRGKGGWRLRFDDHENDERIEEEDGVKGGQFGQFDEKAWWEIDW